MLFSSPGRLSSLNQVNQFTVNPVTLTSPQVSCVVSLIAVKAGVAVSVIVAVTCIPSSQTWDHLTPESKYEH